MNIESLLGDLFSYKEDHSLRFNDNNYILAIKDEDYPEKNIIPILYYDNGDVRGIDTYDMERIATTPNSRMEVAPLSERYSLNQLIKISFGNIIENDWWSEGSTYPKSKTFHTNIHSLKDNEIIEIFEGDLDEAKSRLKIVEESLNSVIIDSYLIKKNSFFILQNKKLIGPLTINNKDSEGYYTVDKSSWRVYGEYAIEEKTFIEFEVNRVLRRIIIPKFNILRLEKELVLMSDDEIIENFKKNIAYNKDIFSLSEQNKLVNLLKRTTSYKNINKYIQSNDRLKDIISKSQDIAISNVELAEVLPEISSIKAEIGDLNEQKFTNEKSLKLLIKRKEDINSEIGEQEGRRKELIVELEDLSKTKELELQNVKSDLESEIKVLEEEKDNLEESISEEKRTKEDELQHIKAEIEIRTQDKAELAGVVEKLRQDNYNAQRDSQKQLMDLLRNKKHFDFLSGRDLSFYDSGDIEKFNNYPLKEDSLYSDYEVFRDKVSKLLAKNGRKLDNHFLDNLLISIHQNTLTIFAGLPGTGKTSLARLLTHILTPSERVVEVSVNRGWTSQKDLIGFHNPLSNKFHSAPTGVFELLSQLNYEGKEKKYLKAPFSYIILDEANLSPIEHYWSTFYNLTDSIAKENSLLKLNLGKDQVFEFANNLRFIATINYDQTTESLSPRVLDRANIIQLQPISFSINDITNEEVESLQISYDQCKEFFKILDFSESKHDFTLNADIDQIFNEVKLQFIDLKIPISPRVEISIKRYCKVAEDWMREGSRPLDYSISQRLLPLINLQGDIVKQGLYKLLELFKERDLNISYSILKRIIDSGEDKSVFEGNFNYFLTLSHA